MTRSSGRHLRGSEVSFYVKLALDRIKPNLVIGQGTLILNEIRSVSLRIFRKGNLDVQTRKDLAHSAARLHDDLRRARLHVSVTQSLDGASSARRLRDYPRSDSKNKTEINEDSRESIKIRDLRFSIRHRKCRKSDLASRLIRKARSLLHSFLAGLSCKRTITVKPTSAQPPAFPPPLSSPCCARYARPPRRLAPDRA